MDPEDPDEEVVSILRWFEADSGSTPKTTLVSISALAVCRIQRNAQFGKPVPRRLEQDRIQGRRGYGCSGNGIRLDCRPLGRHPELQGRDNGK